MSWNLIVFLVFASLIYFELRSRLAEILGALRQIADIQDRQLSSTGTSQAPQTVTLGDISGLLEEQAQLLKEQHDRTVELLAVNSERLTEIANTLLRIEDPNVQWK